MKITLSLSDKLVSELEKISPEHGRQNRDRMIRKLLRDGITRERQKQVAKLYVERKKTLRQCAELLEVDLEKLMSIFCELKVPLSDEHSPQSRLALRLLQQKNFPRSKKNQSARMNRKGARHVLETPFA